MAVNKLDNSMIDPNDIGTTANKLLQLDGSAKIPAVDGTLLTGIPSSFTKSASDPTISTNPSGGVGSLWANTTSGEVYCCTDATAGSNVWTNVGAGTGNVQLSFPGETYGYTHGGGSPALTNVIDKVSYTTDGNATDVGDLHQAMGYVSGASSETYGYSAGSNEHRDSISKYSFSTDGNGTDIANLTTTRGSGAGCSSATHGYMVGGNPYPSVPSNVTDTIDKYSFVSDADATDIGNQTIGRIQSAGHSDIGGGYGYCSAGGDGLALPGPGANVIDRFPYASDANATDVGDMTVSHYRMGGASSLTHGFTTGGGGGAPINVIDKFAFAASANATDVGDMTGTGWGQYGHSSTTHGYVGPVGHAGTGNDVIEKYSTVTDGNSVDVGNLTVGRIYAAGTQV